MNYRMGTLRHISSSVQVQDHRLVESRKLNKIISVCVFVDGMRSPRTRHGGVSESIDVGCEVPITPRVSVLLHNEGFTVSLTFTDIGGLEVLTPVLINGAMIKSSPASSSTIFPSSLTSFLLAHMPLAVPAITLQAGSSMLTGL